MSGHMVGKRQRQSLTYILSGLIGSDSMVTVPHACLQLQQPDPLPLNLGSQEMEFLSILIPL